MNFLGFVFFQFPIARSAVAAMLVCAGGLLAGCEAVSTPRGPSYLDSYQLGEITVSYVHSDQPLLVAELDGEISKTLAGASALGTVGTRFGVLNRQAKQLALQEAVSANIKPHVRDALTPLFTGSRPARAEVIVRSVFIRARFGLQQLTGTQVFVNGDKRPDNPQLVAGLRLYDQQTGLPLQEIAPITRIDDGSIVLMGGGPEAPKYGPSARLNKLAFEFAQAAANALQRNAAGQDFVIPAIEGDRTTLWSSQTSN